MKKIVASVGLIALTSGMNAVQAQDVPAAPYKPWQVTGKLRGFYDDNINTAPNGPAKVSSWGFQINPGFTLDWQKEQTSAELGYEYTYRYYDKRPFNNTANYDQDHNFHVQLNHAFSERYQVGVYDSFVLGQEPDLLRSAPGLSEFQRVSGDNIRNLGAINLNTVLTPVWGLLLGYNNHLYHYQDHGGSAFAPSTGGLLNRMDQNANLDARWQMQPQTVGVVGYMFSHSAYTGNEPIGFEGATVLYSQNRNSYANTMYLGADHNFNPDLSASARAGGRVTDYYNQPGGSSSEVTPYVTASVKYNYTVESFGMVGLSYNKVPMDIVAGSANSFVKDADAFVLYGNITHRIIPKLFGNLNGQFQDSIFNGGTVDGQSEQYYMVGVDLRYELNTYLSANVGYNYDKVDSDIPNRSYTRNRVYFGVLASY
jgi:hypothetical protein